MVAVSVTGLAKEDLSDVSNQDFYDKAVEAGVVGSGEDDTPSPLADRPCILDYESTGDFDKAGEPGSNCHAAFLALAADCNADGLTGLITPGQFRIHGASAIPLRNGGGMQGVRHGDNTGGYDSGRRGVTFLIPHSSDRMVPIFAVQRGAYLANITAYYEDVVQRLRDSAYHIDASDYPDISGAPEVYAPFLVTQHRLNDAGVVTAGGRNVGGVRIENLNLIGAYDGIYLGDADPSEEPWAGPYASLKAKGVPGITIDGYGGYVLRRNLVVERSNNRVVCKGFKFTPANWTEAGQMGVTGVDELTGLDPQGWPESNPQPLIRWAQQNNVMFLFRRKVLATIDDVGARCGRQLIRCEAPRVLPDKTITGAIRGEATTFLTAAAHGLNPENWVWIEEVQGLGGLFDAGGAWQVTAVPTPTAFTVAQDTQAVSNYASGGVAAGPTGPAGQDIGKFRFRARTVAVERYPTLLRLEPETYMHRTQIEAVGHFMDHDDKACTAAVIDVATDKALAGSIQKRRVEVKDAEGVYPGEEGWIPTYREAGTWKPMENYVGFANAFDLQVQEASGPIIETNAEDGHTRYRVTGALMGSWCQGKDTDAARTKHTMAAFWMTSVHNALFHSGTTMSTRDNTSSRVYRMADHAKLFPVNNAYYLEDEAGVTPDDPDFAGFVGCHVSEQLDTLDEDEDGDGEAMFGSPDGDLGDDEP